MIDWQSIPEKVDLTTAPFDGKPVLLRDYDSVCFARWDKYDAWWCVLIWHNCNDKARDYDGCHYVQPLVRADSLKWATMPSW